MAAIGMVVSVLAIVVLVGLVGGSPTVAYAHAALESSVPAANSVLETGPPQIVLDFDESVEADLASIALYEGDGVAVELGKPAAGADDTIVDVSVPSLDDGIYAVVWRSPPPTDTWSTVRSASRSAPPRPETASN